MAKSSQYKKSFVKKPNRYQFAKSLGKKFNNRKRRVEKRTRLDAKRYINKSLGGAA